MLLFWKKKDKDKPQVKCSECGASNPADARFCLECGANLEEQQKVASKVNEATQITEDFKDKGGFWAKWVPGYRGYKRKEIRRESDKLLRVHLVKTLQRAKDNLTDLQEDAVEDAPGILGKLEDMLVELDTFTRKIDHADYGYGAMFGSNKIREDELDKLIEFDRGMVEVVSEVDSAIKGLASNLSEDAEDKVKQIRKFIKKAIQLYGQRDEYIVGWSVEE
ncbi:zinc-ribbon domain-containing protein [Candidatus Bathyarchaeota archaeon]|nr:zinc-ribbon domain-containing protein [Candidatus Bathyarchaeota archaeon]